MTCKTFEVRDRATFVPVLAIRLDPADERDRWLLERGGYGSTPADQAQYVLLGRLADGVNEFTFDPFQQRAGRTFFEAHFYIRDHFDELETGAVIDVEFILGETGRPKESEQRSLRGKETV